MFGRIVLFVVPASLYGRIVSFVKLGSLYGRIVSFVKPGSVIISVGTDVFDCLQFCKGHGSGTGSGIHKS